MNKTNTKNSGLARTIIFPCRGGFRAVCLDFDLIEDGEIREEAENSIRESVIGYIECICKNNLDDQLLNRHANERYWKIYESYLDLIRNKVKKPVSTNLKKTSLIIYPIEKMRISEKDIKHDSRIIKEIRKLRAQLPKEINVLARQGDKGQYCIEVPAFTGCFTEGNTIEELIIMVNDLVRVYLDIPREYLKFMPVYVPKDKIKGIWCLAN
jgi:predicted RNase H-like HicB family nuclease